MLRYHIMSPWIRGALVVFVSTLTVAAHAQEFVLSVDVPVISLDVSVTDTAGQPVDGLTAEDFKILENGEPQRVRYFGPSTAPYHVYLLFDRSGSTRHKWDFMRRAASGLIELIKPQDQVSIGTFGAELKTLAGWKDSRATALEAFDPLTNAWTSAGTTEFYRSVERALENSFEGIRERRAMIVLTDGRDTSLYREIIRRNRVIEPEDDRRFTSLYRTAADRRIPVYFIAVNTDLNLDAYTDGADEHRNLKIIYKGSPIPDRYLEQVRIRMERIAAISGGQVLYPESLDEVIPLFQKMGTTLGGSYSVGYAPKIEGPDRTLQRIVVEVGNGAHTVRQSRAGYYVTVPH